MRQGGNRSVQPTYAAHDWFFQRCVPVSCATTDAWRIREKKDSRLLLVKRSSPVLLRDPVRIACELENRLFDTSSDYRSKTLHGSARPVSITSRPSNNPAVKLNHPRKAQHAFHRFGASHRGVPHSSIRDAHVRVGSPCPFASLSPADQPEPRAISLCHLR